MVIALHFALHTANQWTRQAPKALAIYIVGGIAASTLGGVLPCWLGLMMGAALHVANYIHGVVASIEYN